MLFISMFCGYDATTQSMLMPCQYYLCRCAITIYHSLLLVRTRIIRTHDAMSMPCRCHVDATSMPCRCRVHAMSMPCRCYVDAMSMPCRCAHCCQWERHTTPCRCYHDQPLHPTCRKRQRRSRKPTANIVTQCRTYAKFIEVYVITNACRPQVTFHMLLRHGAWCVAAFIGR